MELKEYIVTLKNQEDLEEFYKDMENMVEHDHVPNRECECANRRITSRNTHYMLCEEEAVSLREDPRVLAVEVIPEERGVKPILHYTQYSANWDKSSTVVNTHRNWGLLRSTRSTNIANWGSDVTPNQAGTADIAGSGKNVDVVIVDELVLPDHPEFAVNADGTGGSRVKQINWYHYKPSAFTASNISVNLLGAASLTQSVTPTTGSNADGFWTLTIPWNVVYFGGPTNKIHVGTNSYITFGEGAGSSVYSGLGVSNPNFPKIMMSAADRGCQRIYYGTEGSSPTRTYRVRWEGSNGDSGTLGAPDMVWEAVFYEATPGRIDIHRGATSSGGISGFYTATSLLAALTSTVNTAQKIEFDSTKTFVYNSTYAGDHGTHVAGTVAGNTQGWAKDANIYSISPFDPDPAAQGIATTEIFDIIREFHKNKPVNPATGIRNPTICNNSWGYNGGASYSNVQSVSWRGTIYNSPPSVSGVSNIASETAELPGTTTWVPSKDSGFRITTSPGSGSVTSITNTLLGAASLTASTTPTFNHPTYTAGDDGFWDLSLPFSISFNGTNYNNIYVNTNSYVLFGSRPSVNNFDQTIQYGYSAANPAYPKIQISAGDRSCQRIYYGTEGSAPNRTYRVRWEGHSSYTGGVLGSPTFVWEMIFYENNTAQIDIQVGANPFDKNYGGWGQSDFLSYGVIPSGYSFSLTNNTYVPSSVTWPASVTAITTDIIDSINDGVVQVAAAGNSSYKHTKLGNIDYNNNITYNYNGSFYTEYYHRGGSPDSDGTMICVGAISPLASELKADFSDCGERVDVYAPGEHIISSVAKSGPQYYNALVTTPADSRNSSYYVDKYGGTSMASPQVCGALACLMETNQTLNQATALSWISQNSSTMPNSTDPESYSNLRHLQGSPARYLFLRQAVNFDITASSAVNFNNKLSYHTPTTISDVSLTFSSVDNIYSQVVPINFTLNDGVLSIPGSGQNLQRQVPGYLLGRRPSGKQLYPRGIFNR
jgi:hypothetical protein